MAWKASASSEFPVLIQLGSTRSSHSAPKNCTVSTRSAVFPPPVSPVKWMLKSLPPSTARQIAAKSGMVMRAGATSISAPENKPYGERGAGVRDPFGNSWFIATYGTGAKM